MKEAIRKPNLAIENIAANCFDGVYVTSNIGQKDAQRINANRGSQPSYSASRFALHSS